MKPYPLCYLLFWTIMTGLPSCKKDSVPKEEACDLPYCHYLRLNYDSYIEIPNHVALNPTAAITIEGWVRLDNYAASNYFVHKKVNYSAQGYYVRVAEQDGQQLLSSYAGGGAVKRSGAFPILTWTHWAVTSDGIHRRHYINGHLTAKTKETQSIFAPCSAPLLFGKDMAAHSGLAEFRLWKVARTEAQIRATMNKDITMPKPGLVAVWPLEENANDIIGSRNGLLHNHPSFKIWSP